MRSLPALLAGAVLFSTVSCLAEEPAQLQKQLRELQILVGKLEDKVQAQQAHIAALERRIDGGRDLSTRHEISGADEHGNAPHDHADADVHHGPAPEFGLVADITAISSDEGDDDHGNDKLSVRELEFSVGAKLGPQTRFDSTVALSDFEEVHIEEAALTAEELPFGLAARLGRYRPAVGKATAVHRHALDTVDEPLVVERYFGEEGFFRTGLELTHSLPKRLTGYEHALTAGVLEGGVEHGGSVFGENRRRPTFYAHLDNRFEGQRSAVDFGLSYLVGSSDEDAGYEVNLFGVDLTARHTIRGGSVLKLQAESYLQHRSEPSEQGEGHEHRSLAFGLQEHGALWEQELNEAFNDDPWGTYLLLDLRLPIDLALGTRWDYVQPINGPTAGRSGDTALTGYVTFFQSAFARWRAQYQHINFAGRGHDDRFALQATFNVGSHDHE